jgi:hypothetical protein
VRGNLKIIFLRRQGFDFGDCGILIIEPGLGPRFATVFLRRSAGSVFAVQSVHLTEGVTHAREVPACPQS